MTDKKPLIEIFDDGKNDTNFGSKTLDEIYDEIQTLYLSDKRPWIVGFSGGKDSTTALQLIWYALSQLSQNKLHKKVYVISSDTLVETPAIVNHIDISLKKIQLKAEEVNLPFEVSKVKPEINQTFWVNLLGRGYPAPNRDFRWCTDRMKIKPATKFILDKIDSTGEVIVVLGVRSDESSTRAQVMQLQKSKVADDLLSAHSTIPGARVYTPIADFSLDDVWTYLLNFESPWENSNRDLLVLYQSASGECPLVVDTSTQSCGNSRFGCWTCTVVNKDVALESMIDQGEEWMEPMLVFRDFLKSTQKSHRKVETRSPVRRSGQLTHKNLKNEQGKRELDTNTIAFGPYFLDFRKEMLKKLLLAQKEVQAEGPNKELLLITHEELKEIRRLWIFEEGDWKDELPQLYEEITGNNFEIIADDFGRFNETDLEVLSEITKELGVELELVIRLLNMERLTYGMANRPKIHKKIKSILKRNYQNPEDIISKIYQMKKSHLIEKLKEEETN